MNCIICNFNATKIMNGVFRCPKCLHIYRDVTFTNDFYTSGEYRQKHHQNISNVTRWIPNIISYGQDILDKSKTILEVGSGDGIFTKHLISLGKEMISCELDPIISESYKWKKYVGDFTELNIEDNVDLTIAFDVIEHIKNPDLFFKKVRSTYIFGQVPINRFLRPINTDDTHFHYFSPQSLRSCAIKHNINILKCKIAPKGFSANGQELLFIGEKI